MSFLISVYISRSNPPSDAKIVEGLVVGKLQVLLCFKRSMVSLQAALSPREKRTSPDLENFLPKKRKCRDGEESEESLPTKELKLAKAEEEEDEEVELNLDAPLPLDWQRCLDIKSGQIHFYNTRTHRRTSRDPRLILEPPCSPLSLDLELNLACEPPRSRIDIEEEQQMKQDICRKTRNSKDDAGGISPSLSWMSNDADPEEMVAAVCMRCHMLVMMSKATLSCPNCKFVHPPNRSSSTLIKPAVKLLCCKD